MQCNCLGRSDKSENVTALNYRHVAPVFFGEDEQAIDPLTLVDDVLPFPVREDRPGGPVHEPGAADDALWYGLNPLPW
jgi:hypothetical protein